MPSPAPTSFPLVEVEPITRLREVLAEHKTIKATAAVLNLNNAYVGDLLLERRPYSDRALAALGLRRAVVVADQKHIRRVLKSTTRRRLV